MKLNYKKTFFVGTAFFLICLFWQAYDAIIPKILTDKFGLSQTASGAIMALDNILALFMLPLFGAISDKANFKHGKRTPFIVVGTLIAACMFVGLSFADNMQLTRLDAVTPEKQTAAMEVLYDADLTVKTPMGEEIEICERFSKEEFLSFTDIESREYTDYVVPARQAYAWNQTKQSPVTLVVFMVMLLVVLIAMATFRSPAVALMPDVTVKPLRSKANAVINLMGTLGGALVLVLGIVFGTGKPANALMSYIPYFTLVAGIMLLMLLLFILNVREVKWAKEMQEESLALGIEENAPEAEGKEERKLSKSEFRSLIFILLSVMLWFMGYNAVTSKYSVYAGAVLGLDYNLTLIIANAAAIVSYLPVGMISSKIGRKKMILIGVCMLFVAFLSAAFLRQGTPGWVMIILFSLAGIGWASINVNSYPMVVELASGSNTGKFTGFYYTASMAAQTVTPIISGIFMDWKMVTLFPYAAIFVALAFVTMLFVKHGDSKPEAPKDAMEAFHDND